MQDQKQNAETFRALHVPGRPLVLFNIWDAGSARAVTAASAPAIATGSWSVAAAFGFADGEHIPLDVALENLQRIVAATELPVTVDLESGYDDVADTITRAIEAGAIGCNLEDSVPADGSLRAVAEQAERVSIARRAADAAGIPFFINARTDIFLRKEEPGDAVAKAARVIERAQAYADAGANGLFVPGLADAALIARVVEASPLPVNIMVSGSTPPLAELAKLGVARVSHGPGPFIALMKQLEDSARAAMKA